jgi:Domain of unknown function (DUF4185)
MKSKVLVRSFLKLSIGVLVVGIIVTCLSCNCLIKETKESAVKQDTLVNFSVRPANEWTDIFYRTKDWFGADGVFSLNLNGLESIESSANDSIFMYFSDTMTGTVLNDSVENFKMVNNSIASLKGITPSKERVKIELNLDENNNPINFFSPNTPNSNSKEYCWFGDGFVNQEDENSINIFGYRVIDHSEKSWDFEITGVTLLTIPANENPPFKNHTQVDAPLFMDIEGFGKGTFGSGIFVNTEKAGAKNPDGFIYVYGLIDPNKQLVVARVHPQNFKEFNKWRYWDGNDWNKDINTVKPITNRVSNEVSLTPLKDGRYLLVFQEDGIGEHTAIRIGETPVGPFGPIQRIWKAPEVNEPPGIIPYNAKAHPVLSTKEELLISYNTISADYFNDILKYPHMYRPRFIWLKINE